MDIAGSAVVVGSSVVADSSVSILLGVHVPLHSPSTYGGWLISMHRQVGLPVEPLGQAHLQVPGGAGSTPQ